MAIKKRQLFRYQNVTVAKTRQLKEKERQLMVSLARLFKPDSIFIFVTLLDAIFEHGRQFIFQPQFQTKKSLRRKLFSL